MSGPPPAKKMGLSLYADLLDDGKQDASVATISSAPVRYDLKKSDTDSDPQRRKDGTVARLAM